MSKDAYEVMSPSISVAAIRTPDGQVFSVERPGRHHDVIRIMHEAGANPKNRCTQGFLTSGGEFVTREVAAELAIRAGQIKKTNWGDQLYSEDLW